MYEFHASALNWPIEIIDTDFSGGCIDEPTYRSLLLGYKGSRNRKGRIRLRYRPVATQAQLEPDQPHSTTAGAVAAETSLRGQEASHRESATQLAQMQKDLATMKQAWTREKREVKIAHQELSEMMEKLRECQEAAAEMETQGKEQREAEEEVLHIRRPAGTLASPS
ncbi:hypothetical protein BDZ97DRAFT_1763647 [Flammula alnicola]|nr:hypothetical protein BDZ97DRAFT_1763647 [Flammula alnicola]